MGLDPVLPDTAVGDQRYFESRGVLHATDDQFAHFVFFAFQQVDDQFVVSMRWAAQ